ncbi:uncharacterized protein GGS22DRAFT_186896 [Annulohypoxylon maeteangense]|uniref:uncharacterized protein n=1 Tax=Annulohypoxylon maeteangense TaxID=1927788 RepID=UPI002007DB65|nr:uncharacterized protein GGS22DRAFT_186896 [Annulohypoxylon maeteangense]KAI0886824.1 hypothetical protein GGS22DRAFT_186896 [Annulohypoxylon maeteangense]
MPRARSVMRDPIDLAAIRRQAFLQRVNNRHRKLIQRITSIIKPDGRDLLTKDEARTCVQFICMEIRRIEKQGTEGKIEIFLDLSQILDNIFHRDTIESQLWWILKRYKVFKSMPSDRQCRYLTELIEWRNKVGKHDGLYLAYFLPGIQIFDTLSYDHRYLSSNENNWFIWWFTSRQHGSVRVDCNRTQRVIDEDRQFLRKLKVGKKGKI